ncbi:MAG TPA: gamma-glutamyltransferase [Caulobacteraceae bacterium]|nr:gamma-glutamyltransferase [Caulobacteraceae bacterium]
MPNFPRLLPALLIASLVGAPLVSAPAYAKTPPKPTARPAAGAQAVALRPMVAAANPAAVDAGLNVLRAGGSAVDAAVAIQAMLGLVEPQSSGLGGGSFMVYYDAKTKEVTAYDGREVAPAAATPEWFLKPDGTPLSFPDAVHSGRSTGVPGAIAMLALAQKEHGRKPWSSLFGDVERAADNGFVVNARLAGYVARFPLQPDVARYLVRDDGTPLKEGDLKKNPAYAATLRKLAVEGPRAILEGDIARAIVARVGEAPNPSPMTLADLANYRPKETRALCKPYRVYLVCTSQAPSGGPAVQEALGILANTDINTRNANDPQGWFQLIQGMRLAYADRDFYEGDPAFVAFPQAGLLDPAYTAERAKLIGDKAVAIGPGRPAGAQARAADATREPGGTSHFVVVDAAGNVVSMTTTVESPFGSGRMVGGFILNNQLTDFSLAPRDRAGNLVANAVAGGKRPRSSMSPTIVLDKQGKLVLAVGSPGGNSIIAYDLKAIVAYLDWKMPLQEALALPNIVARGAPTVGEGAKLPQTVQDGLAARGIQLRPSGGEESGLHAIGTLHGKQEGAADPRRPGVARSL